MQSDFDVTVYASNPVLSDPSNLGTFGSVVVSGGTWHHYYSYDIDSKHVIGHATSANGISWTKDTDNNPVVNLGAAGKFDDGHAWLPRVWIEGETWYMLYAGNNGSGVVAIGLATSTDGVTWTRQNGGDAILAGTDVGAWDEGDNEIASIIKIDSTYYLWYNTQLAGVNRQTGLATAANLLGPWTKDAGNPIFNNFGGGRFCGDVFKRGSYYFFVTPRYTSAADYSWLEVYRDTDPTFATREYLGVFKYTGADGAWDSHDQDTPWFVTDDITRTLTNGTKYCYYAGELSNNWQTGLITFDASIFD